MRFHRLAEAAFFHIHALFAGNVAGDFERQPVGGIEVESGFAVEARFPLGFEREKQRLQPRRAAFHRAGEAFFLAGQVFEDDFAPLTKFSVEIAVGLDDRVRDLREERLMQPDFRPEARRSADNHAADVISSGVARHHAIRDEERRGARVVGDDAVGREIVIHRRFVLAGQSAERIQRGAEEVGFVVGIHALQHGDDSLEAHTGIHMGRGQRLQMRFVEAVILNEDEIPQFQKARAVAVDAADVVRVVLLVAVFGSSVKMNFGAGTAGTGIRHFPEVIFPPEVKHVVGIHPRLRPPDFRGFFVRRDFAFFVFEAGRP